MRRTPRGVCCCSWPPARLLALVLALEPGKSRRTSKKDKQEGQARRTSKKEKNAARILGVWHQKAPLALVSRSASFAPWPESPRLEPHTQTTARGCFHLQWKQPQRPWSAIRGRGGLVRPCTRNCQNWNLRSERERLISEISGLPGQARYGTRRGHLIPVLSKRSPPPLGPVALCPGVLGVTVHGPGSISEGRFGHHR